jgi:GNAT superfamily N-acetyltransferase
MGALSLSEAREAAIHNAAHVLIEDGVTTVGSQHNVLCRPAAPQHGEQHLAIMQNQHLRPGLGCAMLVYDEAKDPRALIGLIVGLVFDKNEADIVLQPSLAHPVHPFFTKPLASLLIVAASTYTILPKYAVQTALVHTVALKTFVRDWCVYDRPNSPVLSQLRILSRAAGLLPKPSDPLERPTISFAWETVALNKRDAELRNHALRHLCHDRALGDVRVLPQEDGSIYHRTLLFLSVPSHSEFELVWNPKFTQSDVNAFAGECGIYDGALPFSYLHPDQHNLVALHPDGAIAGLLIFKTCKATFAFGELTVVFIELLAVDPKVRGRGLANLLYESALSASYAKTASAFVVCEAVQSGPGWQWWKHRVTNKLPMAIALALQLIVCVDGHELSTRATPCGALLLPAK